VSGSHTFRVRNCSLSVRSGFVPPKLGAQRVAARRCAAHDRPQQPHRAPPRQSSTRERGEGARRAQQQRRPHAGALLGRRRRTTLPRAYRGGVSSARNSCRAHEDPRDAPRTAGRAAGTVIVSRALFAWWMVREHRRQERHAGARHHAGAAALLRPATGATEAGPDRPRAAQAPPVTDDVAAEERVDAPIQYAVLRRSCHSALRRSNPLRRWSAIPASSLVIRGIRGRADYVGSADARPSSGRQLDRVFPTLRLGTARRLAAPLLSRAIAAMA
jgi:hypothetical protein